MLGFFLCFDEQEEEDLVEALFNDLADERLRVRVLFLGLMLS